MLTANQALMRALLPKITPAAMVRRHIEVSTQIAITSETLGMTWFCAYTDAWSRVMFPGEYRGR